MGKRYRIGAAGARITKAREALLHLATAPARNFARLRRLSSFRDEAATDVIWALRDISFEISHGEVLGIIGPNGAGKSTLLKILSRITPPTTGRVELHGRVGSLLEVGTGFHPELTGRDNVYLNGSILGMSKRYIDRRFAEIVEFAGVERFIDTPVKRYSSGMHVRLAFAVAAHLEPEILIVDEVLAVGDAEFQRKCLGKMSEVSGEGRTVLFVSHNLAAVQSLCDRVLWLRDGRVAMDGPTASVIPAYVEAIVATTNRLRWSADLDGGRGNDLVRVLWARVRPEHGEIGEMIDVQTPWIVEIAYRPLVDRPVLRPRIHVVNQERVTVFKSSPHALPAPAGGAELRCDCRIPGNLLNVGRYTLNLRLIREDDSPVLIMDDLLSFEIAESPSLRGGRFWPWGGVVRPLLDWRIVSVPGHPNGDGRGARDPSSRSCTA